MSAKQNRVESYVGPGWEARHTIISVEVIGPFQLLVTFQGGEKRWLNVEPLLHPTTAWTSDLLNPTIFQQVSIDELGSLTWPNEFGFHWSTVYERSIPASIA